MKRIRCWLGFHNWKYFDHLYTINTTSGPMPMWTEKRRHCQCCKVEEMNIAYDIHDPWFRLHKNSNRYKPTESDKVQSTLERYE